jgi:hypothetical protein
VYFGKILGSTEFGHFLSTNNPYRHCEEGQKLLSSGMCEQYLVRMVIKGTKI